MAEKKKWVPTKMFLQWCLSYLLISVIALTLLLASGYRYLDVLRDNLEYTNGVQLDMTRVWLDQKVKLLRNITAKESGTAAIDAVRMADDYDDIPRYDYYMLTRKISTDVINYGIGDAYFLYFPSTDAIVSNTKYGQSRRFYDLVLEAYDISYEDWMEILKQDLVTTRVFQPVVQGKDSKNYLVLMRPLNITSREPDKAVAVMIVDLEDLFKASDWLNNDTLCINDRNNGAAGKAAIEIGNDYNATYNLVVNNAAVNGFADGKNTGSKVWANKNSMDADHLSVTIDGTKVL